MIWYVVTDSLDNYRKKTKWHTIKLTLEDLAGDLCVALHFSQVTQERLRELRPWAICHSGSSTAFSKYDVLTATPFLNCLRRWPGPQLGFCAGHQLTAIAYGGSVGRMRRLRAAEPDPAPAYFPGWFKEKGWCQVQVVKRHPLFNGLPDKLSMMQHHAEEIKTLPRTFDVLATSQECKVQAVAHRTKPLFGVQFHPEAATKKHSHGTQLLRNFFKSARAWQKKMP